MKTCVICGRPIRTGRKYCWEHRNTRSDNVVDRSTKQYVDYHMTKAFVCIVIIAVAIFIPFLYFGFTLKQSWLMIIGLPLSFIFSFYISIKYLKIRFIPAKDVQEKNPEYVDWVQNDVNKVKAEREFRKNLWR